MTLKLLATSKLLAPRKKALGSPALLQAVQLQQENLPESQAEERAMSWAR